MHNKTLHWTICAQHVFVTVLVIPLSRFSQIGRSTESMIDFVVTDTAGSSGQVGGAVGEGGGQSIQSTISRYACRIMCERSAPYTARIYAAGFDSSKNIFLGVSVPSHVGVRHPLVHATGNHSNHSSLTEGMWLFHPRVTS